MGDRSRTPPHPGAVMRRPATGGARRDGSAGSAPADANHNDIQEERDNYAAREVNRQQHQTRDEEAVREAWDEEVEAYTEHDQIFARRGNRDGKGGGGKSKGKDKGKRDHSDRPGGRPGSRGPRPGRRGGRGGGGFAMQAALLGSFTGPAGAVRDTCQAVAVVGPRTELPWGVLVCLLWVLCFLIWVCWCLRHCCRRHWRIQFCRLRPITQDATTQADLPAMADAATQADAPPPPPQPPAGPPLGQDLYWTASGARDLHWHTTRSCEGLNGAQHRVHAHRPCGHCALR